MGILGLAKLIADICPSAIKEYELKSYFGRKVAVDASMSIYQFLIAIRQNNLMMTNEAGDTTSHLVGLFYRTCKLLEAGIKPVYVFDGKAPELKSGELEKRKERRAEAEQKLEEAKETATSEDIGKFSKRLVRVTRQHNEECKKLLRLLGVPVICAPSEAEAQCAQLAKEGLVYGIATEDMDGLTFGTPRLIRHLSSGNSDKCKEFVLEKVLEGLGLSQNQFIDLCILMGCDYCESIKGIGGKKGLELIKEYGSIEEILKKRYGITEFIDPEITYKEKIRDINLLEDENGKTKEPESKIDSEGEEKKETETKPELKENNNGVKKEKDEDNKVKFENENEIKTENPDEGNGSFEMEAVDSDDEITTSKKKKNIKLEDDKESLDGSAGEETEEISESKSKKKKKGGSREIVPEKWLFRGARKLFLEPNVLIKHFTETDLKFKDIDEDGLIEFLCRQNGFSEDRVKAGIKRVKESKGKCAQTRIDTFFKVLPGKDSQVKKAEPAKGGQKRGAPAAKAGGANKRGRRPR